MFTLSFEHLRRVLCLKFTGLLTNEDLDAIDPALVCVAGAQSVASPAVRCLYDMSEIQAIAVPQSRFIERASKPAIGDLTRIVVATLADAYALLDVVVPCFEPLPTPAR